MITIAPCPPADLPSQLVFLAHSDSTASAFQLWSDRIAAPARTIVVRMDRDPAGAALALRGLPVIVPTMHLCAGEAVGAAVTLARNALARPDLLLVTDTGADVQVGAHPIDVPLTIFAVQSGEQSGVTRTASWTGLTNGPITFRVLEAGPGGLLAADSPVPGALTTLIRDVVNDSPIEVEV